MIDWNQKLFLINILHDKENVNLRNPHFSVIGKDYFVFV